MQTLLDPPVIGYFRSAPWDAWYTRTADVTGQSVLLVSESNGDYSTPNAFSQVETHIEGAVISGDTGNDYIWYYSSYDHMPTRIYDSYQRVDYLPVPGGLANRLFANSSPDRADVLLPAAVFELKDLPQAIYHAGRKLFKSKKLSSPQFRRKPGLTQVSADWVAINFGWLPLIGDLITLSQFSDLAAKREKEFDKLYSKRGLKRRLTLNNDEGPVSGNYAVGAPFWADISYGTGMCTQKIWGTCRWSPKTSSSGSPLARPTPDYVRRAVLGLNAKNLTANVWEALPWSWFVDYFFHVQDYLIANSGFYTAVPSAGCIMIHHKTTMTYPPLTMTDTFGRQVSLSQGTHTNESKDRMVVYPESIEASFPILSAKQLSILGALAVLKAPRNA